MAEDKQARWRDFDILKLAKIIVVGGIVIAVITVGVPPTIQYVGNALAQPEITLTDRNFGGQGCGLFGSTQTYTYFFTLVNTGDADGFAQVHFLLDGERVADDVYLVRVGESVDKSAAINVGDCESHTLGVVIGSTWKA